MKDPLRFYGWRCKLSVIEEVLYRYKEILEPVADTVVVDEAREVYRNVPKRISTLDLFLRTYTSLKKKCDNESTTSIIQVKIWIYKGYCYFKPCGFMFAWKYCDLLNPENIDIRSYEDFSYWSSDRPRHIEYDQWEKREKIWDKIERSATRYMVLDFLELNRDKFIRNYANWVEVGGNLEERLRNVPKRFKRFFRAVEQNHELKKLSAKPFMTAKMGSGTGNGHKAALRVVIDESDDQLS